MTEPRNPWAPEGWDDEDNASGERQRASRPAPSKNVTAPIEPGAVLDHAPATIYDFEDAPAEVSTEATPFDAPAQPPRTPVTPADHPEFFQRSVPRPAADVDPEFTAVVSGPAPAATGSSDASSVTGVADTATSDATVISTLGLTPSRAPEPLELVDRALVLTRSASAPSYDDLVAEGYRRAEATPTVAPVTIAEDHIDTGSGSDSASRPNHFDSGSISGSGNLSGSGNDSQAVLVDPVSIPQETGWVLRGAGVDTRSLVAATYILGRQPKARPGHADDILVSIDHPSGTVSRTHAQLDFIDGVWHITDLHSTNGVSVVDANGAEILVPDGVPTPVRGRVFVGDAELEFVAVNPRD